MSGPTAPARKTVLVVEDDPTVRAMIVRALGSRCTVHQAKDGMEALELITRIDPQPSLLILDIMMPRVDGLSLARKLKADPNLRVIPIIFLTAKTGSSDMVEGIQAGAKHYLTKPFSISALLEKVDKLLQ